MLNAVILMVWSSFKMDIEAVNDIDCDTETLIPLNEQLAKCDSMLDDDEGSTSNFDQCTTVENCTTNEEDVLARPSTSKCGNFQVCKDTIPCVPKDEQDEELLGLGVSFYDQTQFENEVMDQVDKAMKAQEEEKRKGEIERELKTVAEDIKYEHFK